MTCNYSTIEVEAEEIKYENVKFAFYILRIYTTLTHLPTIILYRTHSDEK